MLKQDVKRSELEAITWTTLRLGLVALIFEPKLSVARNQQLANMESGAEIAN